ncbi:sulfur oxidation c-type cytochrome SoxX [Pseudogemmobacter sp. W21_MBD1_M6]|uniref:sulfur oxidation c-type cytochrome SoxX n=1 Tax=Pseudogemmobacter sp. W21_MBD1_M6 TaxID=3240271 RepID=UPI003F946617
MKRALLGMAVIAAATTASYAADVAPTSVIFTDGAVEVSLTGTPGDAAQGRKVMGSRAMGNCVACHMVSDMPDVAFQGNVGPTLDGAADRWTEAQLRGIVSNAKMMFDGTVMPSFYKTTNFIRPGDDYTGKAAPADLPPILAGQQIEDVVAYLLTLKE